MSETTPRRRRTRPLRAGDILHEPVPARPALDPPALAGAETDVPALEAAPVAPSASVPAIRQVAAVPASLPTIDQVAAAVPGVIATDSVRVRWVGHRLDASLHVVVDASLTVAEGHAVAEEVRHDLFHGVDKLDEVVVHVDPDGDHEHHETTRHHLERLGMLPRTDA